ncbi:hypothetical protein GQ600_4808 [Phytophthora cactorum]|nr:hypothetical protein GQ600_11955 [Phytophthora cactorum]KAF1791555.1 hypothetical protein GQ600_4808 [Phytophthora cactorum]
MAASVASAFASEARESTPSPLKSMSPTRRVIGRAELIVGVADESVVLSLASAAGRKVTAQQSIACQLQSSRRSVWSLSRSVSQNATASSRRGAAY